MSRYIVRVVGPAGRETYLYRGREVERDKATRYSSSYAAWIALRAYRKKSGLLILDIIDTRDPERQV
jgi:hypothetical protein